MVWLDFTLICEWTCKGNTPHCHFKQAMNMWIKLLLVKLIIELYLTSIAWYCSATAIYGFLLCHSLLQWHYNFKLPMYIWIAFLAEWVVVHIFAFFLTEISVYWHFINHILTLIYYVIVTLQLKLVMVTVKLDNTIIIHCQGGGRLSKPFQALTFNFVMQVQYPSIINSELLKSEYTSTWVEELRISNKPIRIKYQVQKHQII